MKYIIFTGTIVLMGGAQMYVKNKVEYMRTLGWDVYVFSGVEGKIMVNGLSEFKDSIIPELKYYPNLVRNKRVIKRIVNKIGYLDESDEKIIIESNTIHISCWAEIIAKKLNAKHFMFILDEYFNYSDEYFDFIKFKFDRKEIAVIKDTFVSKILHGRVEITDPSQFKLVAECTNVVEDVKDERFDSIDYSLFDHTICSLGRLNKNYIPSVVDGFEKFAYNHPDKRICFIFIGDQPKNCIPDMNKIIIDRLDAIPNVTLKMIGYVYPIPSSFFYHVDVGVAASGSANLLRGENVKTISMDVSDGYPIGVLGYTTENILNRDKELIIGLDEWLDRILYKDYLNDFCFNKPPEMAFGYWLSKHMLFVDKSDQNKVYYDISGIKIYSPNEKKKKMLFFLLGVRNCQKLKSLLKKRWMK